MEAKATAEAWFRVERWALILLCVAAVCLLAAVVAGAMGTRRQMAAEAEIETELSGATAYPIPVGDQLEGAAGG